MCIVPLSQPNKVIQSCWVFFFVMFRFFSRVKTEAPACHCSVSVMFVDKVFTRCFLFCFLPRELTDALFSLQPVEATRKK